MPQIIILDTHIWFWWMSQEYQNFPKQWSGIIEAAEKVVVSPVSCFEIALLHQRNRLSLPCEPREWFQEALAPAGVELLAISAEIAARAAALSQIHKDPFDRIIIASALESQAKLASIDSQFPKYVEVQSSLLQS